MKKYEITEENFETIMEKMQRICNKRKMLEFSSEYDPITGKEIGARKKPIYFRRGMKRLGINSTFIDITKHFLRNEFEKDAESYQAKMYAEEKTVIHLSLDVDMGASLRIGDSIRFLPFGVFIIYTDNKSLVKAGVPYKLYKDIYVPDIRKCGKILDVEQQRTSRIEAEYELEELYMATNGARDDYDDFYDYGEDYEW